jgi:uncharacterized cysteine cluster protein YcgN (CxxCxxCC family)
MTGSAFWLIKTPEQMSEAEWESLCDGCGRCCLVKLEDEDSGDVYNTSVACHLLDLETCRCSDYEHRLQRVPMCVKVDIKNTEYLSWMPSTCAYRLLAKGQSLPDWHPLISGQLSSVHDAGASVQDFAVSEEYIDPDQMEDFITEKLAG